MNANGGMHSASGLPDAIAVLMLRARELTESLANLATDLDLYGVEEDHMEALPNLLAELGTLDNASSTLEKSYRRREEGRSPFRAEATVRIVHSELQASVRDVSAHGAGLVLDSPIEVAVTIPFDGVNVTQLGVLRWANRKACGFEFPEVYPPRTLLY